MFRKNQNKNRNYLEKAIDFMQDAIYRGDFGASTSDYLDYGVYLLKALNNKHSGLSEKLDEFKQIVIGSLTLAMAVESRKYGKFKTEISCNDLLQMCQQPTSYSPGWLSNQTYPATAEQIKTTTALIHDIAHKVLVTKEVPEFKSVELFSKANISIQQLLLLSSNISTPNQEISSPSMTRK